MDQSDLLLVVSPTAAPEFARLRDIPHVRVTDAAPSVEITRHATSILNWTGPKQLLRETFLACPNLRWVHSRGAGVDSVLFPELIESDVVLTNGKGSFSAALGEFALAAILYFAKNIPRLRKQQAARLWEVFEVNRIAGQTVGIIGYGDIGRAVAERVHPMGMRVLATRRQIPSTPDPLVERYFAPADLRAMVALCDYVVAATPLTEETRHMIGDAVFGAMKSSAIFMNLGRGPVVDEEALIKALSAGTIRGAALDVFEKEPLPSDSPLYGMDQVLLSPHSADVTSDWLDRAMDLFLDQYHRFKSDEPLRNVVNKRLGY
jgi:phosphoglycerate dehydrogenase-like enzyme